MLKKYRTWEHHFRPFRTKVLDEVTALWKLGTKPEEEDPLEAFMSSLYESGDVAEQGRLWEARSIGI